MALLELVSKRCPPSLIPVNSEAGVLMCTDETALLRIDYYWNVDNSWVLLFKYGVAVIPVLQRFNSFGAAFVYAAFYAQQCFPDKRCKTRSIVDFLTSVLCASQSSILQDICDENSALESALQVLNLVD